MVLGESDCHLIRLQFRDRSNGIKKKSIPINFKLVENVKFFQNFVHIIYKQLACARK